MKRVPTTLLVAAALTAHARTQIPAHAVRLDATASIRTAHVLGDGDQVAVVGLSSDPIPFVHASRSADGGRTWPVLQVPLGLATLGAVCREGPTLHVVGCDLLQPGPRIVSSYDGGATWQWPVPVSATSTLSLGTIAEVAVEGSHVSVVWLDVVATAGQGNRTVVLTNRSTDGGLTWSATDTLLPGPLAQPTVSGLRLVAHGAERHVFWSETDARGGGEHTLYARSLDRGATWSPTQTLGSQLLHRAAGSSSTLLTVDLLGTALRRSADGGATWSLVSGHGIQQVDDLAVHGDRVLLVGHAPASLPLVGYIALQMSRDGGSTWLPQPYLVPKVRSTRGRAHVTSDAAFVNVEFSPSFALPAAGAVLQSDDTGATWRLAVDAGGQALHADSDRAVVVAHGAGASSWCFVMSGHTSLGVGAAGRGGIVPTLRGRLLPGLGRVFLLDVAGAVGGTRGLLAASFGPTVDLPFGAARLYVGQPMATTLLPVGGTPGQPGAGAGTLALMVPNVAAAIGLRLVSQVFLLDGNAPGGFAATAACETWFR